MNISKNFILHLFSFIAKCLYNDKYEAINESCSISNYALLGKITMAQDKLSDFETTMIPIDTPLSPINLLELWKQFDNNFDGSISVVIKRQYENLITSTTNFINELVSRLSIDSSIKTEPINSVEEADLKKLFIANKRKILMDKLEQEREKKPQDKDAIKSIENQLLKLNTEYNELKEAKEKVLSYKVAVDNVSERISTAFEQLESYTKVIEKEQEHVNWEYITALICIPSFAVCFIALYVWFLMVYNDNLEKFNSWLAFLPYTIMIPVFIALLWLCVYLKDRASKISIELSTRLFNIRYLEGLMKLTNSLSFNSNEALNRINTTADSLMKSYLSQISRNHLTEIEVSKMECSELESNPYWKFLYEIKELIKLIKQ